MVYHEVLVVSRYFLKKTKKFCNMFFFFYKFDKKKAKIVITTQKIKTLRLYI